MKTLWGKSLLIIGTLLLLTLVQINDASQTPHGHHGRVVRQAPSSGIAAEKTNDFDLTSIKDFLDKIPIVGPIVDTIYNYVSEFVTDLDKLTNGIIPRLLGGSLPCELTIKKLVCSGTSKNGGTFGVVKNIIYSLPETILPDTLKDGVIDFIEMVINPIANALFGGLPE